LFRAQRCADVALANLTLRNTTRQGGSQAEAIILDGTTEAHAILANVDLYSCQDTLQINGQAYVGNCYVEGDVDFLWGTGPCYFENCHMTTVRDKAYYLQVRNPAANHGYVFNKCIFDGKPGIKDNYLARIEPQRFPASEVVLLDCVLTSAVGGQAWLFNGNGPTEQIHFWEFNSHDASGKPVDTSARLAASKRLTQPADAETIRNYSDATWVLGGRWTPVLAPTITKPPHLGGGGGAFGGAETVSIEVEAVSVPAAGYQWFKDGVAITGATNRNVMVSPQRSTDSGDYSVVVRNAAGEGKSAAMRFPAAR